MSGLRFGYGTNGFANHRLADALGLIADLGYTGVALTLDHCHVDPYAADAAAQQRRSPDNVATVVTWLASDRAQWCTGQVVGAREFEVSLFGLSRPVVLLAADGPWDRAALADAADEHVEGLVRELPFPSWPPAPAPDEIVVAHPGPAR